MRGGSLTRFRPDEYYDQDAKGMLAFPIIDFTPPLPKCCVQEYYHQFSYQPVGAQCYVDGCHRPLMSKSYWVEKDKKVNPHSPLSGIWHHGPHQKKKKKRKKKKTSWSRECRRKHFSPLGFGQKKEKTKRKWMVARFQTKYPSRL